MAIVHLSGAPLVNLVETTNASGEIVLSGLYQGTPVRQTLRCDPPCIIFFKVSTMNFYAIHIEDFQPDWEFVEIVNAIT